MTSSLYAPSPVQLTAFGSIVQSFARHETLWAAMVARLIKTDMKYSFVLMSSLSYRGKKDSIFGILHHVNIPSEQKERIKWFVSQVHKHNQLRNSIAHHVWIPGSRPGSIKPAYFDVRGGKGDVVGDDETERDYTDDELVACADDLAVLYNNFSAYLVSVGLLPAADKIASTSSATVESSGAPSIR